MDTEESNSSDAEVIETGDIPDFYGINKNVQASTDATSFPTCEQQKKVGEHPKEVSECELLLQNCKGYFQLYQAAVAQKDEIKQQFYQFKCMIKNHLKIIREASVCKELKMSNNEHQINNILQEMHELKQQNIQKQLKLSQTQTDNVVLRNDRDNMQKQNMKLQKEIAVLKNELEEQKELQLQLKQLKEENSLLKDEVAVLRMKNIDVTNYENWTVEHIIYWILSLENGRYKKYKKQLKESMIEEEITGECLADIEESNLKDWGLKSFKDRKALFKNIKLLCTQSQNKTDSNMIPEGSNQTIFY